MDNLKINKLKDQIWVTRISRVNAEARLQNKEKFVQGINVYYSCVTIVYSILSYVNHDDSLSLVTIFMTISLLITIMHLNAQNFSGQAHEFRDNYTEFQKLELELDNIELNSTVDLKDIEERYCDLLKKYNNHISFDYYKTMMNSTVEFRAMKNWTKYKEVKYYFGVIWRKALSFMLIILPIILYIVKGKIINVCI
jgi:hypothetical protein